MILDSAARIQAYTGNGWGTDTIFDLFARNVDASPDAVAVADPPNRAEIAVGEARRLTYRELARAEGRLAAALIQVGVTRDDVVVVQLPNLVELVATYLAAARIGAILSPVPVQYRAHELRRIMRIVEPKAFVTTAYCAGFDAVRMVCELQPEVPSLKAIFAIERNAAAGVLALTPFDDGPGQGASDEHHLKAAPAHRPVTANDIWTICWTSGTEAEPRAVPRSHNQWIWIGYASVDGCELDPGCSLLNPFPLVNMAGIGGMLVPWLLTGGKLALHHPLSLPIFLDQIRSERPSYTVVPPALLNMLLAQPTILDTADLSSLKTIGSGSAPLSPGMVAQYDEKYGIPIVNLFGSNEGASFTSGPRELPDPADRARFFPRFGVPGFDWRSRVAAQMTTRLVDPTTREPIAEPGVPGEMAIKSPGIFPGYYRHPDLNEIVFDRDGFYYTGDLFEIADEAGRLDRYRYIGRVNDLVNRGGVKISPEEIEGLILEHPAVADVAVVGYPDDTLGERVCAVVVPKPGQSIELESIGELLLDRDVARYKLPERLVIVESLPRNPVGKVVRRLVREQIRVGLIDGAQRPGIRDCSTTSQRA